ncbi:MAG: hypothetical protein FWC24_06305 [Treponema sp.]|nr:hypothetical protein [Treponema sp.]
MKKIMVACAFLLVMGNLAAHVQGNNSDMSFQIDPILFISQILEDEIQIEFDLRYKINDFWNILFRPNFSMNTVNFDDVSLSFIPGVIFRPFATGLRGVYAGIYPNIGWRNTKMKKDGQDFLIVGAGAEVGYSWIFRSGLTFTLGGGWLKNRYFELNGKSKQPDDIDVWNDFRFIFLLGYSL